MNLSEAISLFEERCESPIDVAALECIRAALAEVQKPDVQQLKPKMPSYEECVTGIGDSPKGVVSPGSVIVGMVLMYKYIARHIGH